MAQYALPVLHDASEVKTSWVQLAGDGDGYASDELDEGFGSGRGSGSGPDGATTAWQTDNTSSVTRTYECAITSLKDPQSTGGHIIRAHGAKSVTGGCTLTATLYLFQGTTHIAASAPTVISATAYSTLSYTLSAAEVEAITDYDNLRLRLSVVFSTGTARRGRVSALELETPDAPHKVFYIIPMTTVVEGSRTIQKPDFVDALQCNWTGHNLDHYNVYICMVNTTEAKHTQLAAQTGVRQLPRVKLSRLVSSMPAGVISKIQTVLTNLDLPYYADESLKQLMQRILVSGLFEIPNISLDTLLRDLPQAVQTRGAAFMDKWGVSYSGTDTVGQIIARCRDVFWNPDTVDVEEY
jgi:hypothetical protein